ncbi:MULTISPECIES: hypothetical protein [Streptomyces]|uniref:hypothetical protein n=1 Tax=Streptomyces TaxID=1883 RepID=UPI000E6772C9|nr:MULTISPECIES: hypothetical protein [Streptomyces]MDX3066255.1 hypothetical protein [Streptomyces sp. ND04-05B]MDX3519634.1 hypothetical protein [Streptomyces scabiei]
MRPDFQHYAIQHGDGRWLYYLPHPPGLPASLRTSVLADGEPMQPLEDASGGWWVTGHRAERLTAVYQPRPTVTGYRLTDLSARSERFPEYLSVQGWHQALGDSGHSEAYYSLYEQVTQDRDVQEYVYEGRTVVLTGGEPPTPGGPPWVASMPESLVQRPEYHHCFPGYIPGLRDHLRDLIRRLGHVEHCFNGRSGKPHGLYVTVAVPFDEPVSRWVPYIGANGRPLKSGRNEPVLVRREMYLPVADHVSGPDYHTALAEWEQQVSFWLDLVRNAAVRACNACEGTGHVMDVPEGVHAPGPISALAPSR